MLVLALPAEPKQGRSTRARVHDAEARALPVAHRDASPQDPELAQRARAFDTTVQLRSEAEREMNALRALSMEQIKRDDELLKKWIALI